MFHVQKSFQFLSTDKTEFQQIIRNLTITFQEAFFSRRKKILSHLPEAVRCGGGGSVAVPDRL